MGGQWYYAAVGGTRRGPVPWEQLVALASSGDLKPNDVVWTDGYPEWVAASTVLGLGGALPPMRTRPPVDPNMKWIIPINVSPWAMASGYFGLLSVVGCGAPFAIVTGLIALWHISKHPGMSGRGRAYFGIAMGVVCPIVIAYLVQNSTWY